MRRHELDTLLILKGGATARINAKNGSARSAEAELQERLVKEEEPAPLRRPEMATYYREHDGLLTGR